METERKRILSLELSTYSYQGSLRKIMDWAKEKRSAYVCFSNVHMTIEAWDDKNFANQVNSADLVCADGMPLVEAIKKVYKKSVERVAGMDMMPSVLEKAEAEHQSVYFYGSTDEMLEKIVLEAKRKYPNLPIAGKLSPPFRALSKAEESKIISDINASGASIVFVALGCPKQEKWMAKHSPQINAVLLGVGGAFPVFAGVQDRAPTWMRNFSLEWMYRLYQDPKRLFKRYFYTNSKFIFLLMQGNPRPKF